MKKECTFKFFGKTWVLKRKSMTEMLEQDGTLINGSAEEESTGACVLSVADDLTGEKFLEVLLHELTEYAIANVGGVYVEYGAGTCDRIFMFNHKQFSTICGDISSAYEYCKKKLGVKDAV